MTEDAVADIEIPADRDATAHATLNGALVIAALPAVLATGALALSRMGVIDWWTAYGQILIGDASHLGLALKIALFSVMTTGAGLGVALWAGPERYYARAMLNVALTGLCIAALVAFRS
jgi:hypothetical protein